MSEISRSMWLLVLSHQERIVLEALDVPVNNCRKVTTDQDQVITILNIEDMEKVWPYKQF